MNPFPIVIALFRGTWLTSVMFTVLIALSIALGVAITAQERSLRTGSARASDPFDLIVAAPGSRTEILFNVVYLRPSAVELIGTDALAAILSDPDATFAAPIAFGDSAEGFAVVGTTADMIAHLHGAVPMQGTMWQAEDEAIVGAATPFAIGDRIASTHGDPVRGANFASIEPADAHGELAVVGRLPPTGTAWDQGVFVPIQYSWSTHAVMGPGATGTPGVLRPGNALGPVPAVVIDTDALPQAYGLRSRWQTPDTTAFFPAEALTEIYATMGDVRRVMQGLTIATQGLVIAAVLAGVVALMQLYHARLALLRALGASRAYVFAVVWTYIMALILIGAVLGLAIGMGTAQGLALVLGDRTGLALSARLGWAELRLILTVTALDAVCALAPALILFRQSVVTHLR
ncbi:putative ABC transport system permease protein [Loktanella fryxellensis]|uniref:Putative ABC transport system permease protein n=1 Tax=Loktanella fryxellensis TaxID=245187 RepID=A0A1H7ZL49_9RHOB|nr:ABC transporter permease [Loktanella fryxellensis]SEM59045.1 putative ABC transport system permease protein [Loktanella fryxellensis]